MKFFELVKFFLERREQRSPLSFRFWCILNQIFTALQHTTNTWFYLVSHRIKFKELNFMLGNPRDFLQTQILRRFFPPPLASTKKIRYVAFMKLRLLVELDPETNRWSAVFPELPGCASAGDTEAEAIANAKEALELWFEPAPVKMNKGAKMMELAIA
jgi:predicted RNase H-like HicB family nuclease